MAWQFYTDLAALDRKTKGARPGVEYPRRWYAATGHADGYFSKVCNCSMASEPTIGFFGASISHACPFLAQPHFDFDEGITPQKERVRSGQGILGKCWIKLSGPYRIAKQKPLDYVRPIGTALVQTRPDRLIWGSDWPHLPDGQRNTGDLLNLLGDWAADEETRHKILVEGPEQLFYFD